MKLLDLQTGGDFIPSGIPLVCAIGNFDGIHIGHESLLRQTCRLAERYRAVPAVFTFSENTSGAPTVLSPEEKVRRMADIGIVCAVVCGFDEVRALSPEAFVSDVLTGGLAVSLAVCGFNFRFGAGGVGNAETLRTLMKRAGGDAVVMPPSLYAGEPISSSRIRAALGRGDMETVSALLGRPYAVTAPVVPGKHLGGSLGFPTVNQIPPAGVLSPRVGVYASVCRIGDRLIPAVSDFGLRPTVEKQEKPRWETHLLGFEEDLYNRIISVYPLFYLREEVRFSSPEELANAIRRDSEQARAYLAAHPFRLT